MKSADEIQAELEHIRERLADALQLEVTALYAAQQALSWALDSQTYRSPLATITGKSEVSADC